MSTPLIATKLFLPPLRPEVLVRPHLQRVLDSGCDGPLILVSAPAGFGKTTLVSHWARTLSCPVGWVTLDGGDADVGRFLTYLVAALSEMGIEIPASPQTAGENPTPLLTALVNDLARATQPFVLVLDDFHQAASPAVREVVQFLIEHGPPQFHLLLVTRADPGLPLARWRASGALTELRAEQLRFSRTEAETFLNDTLGLALTAEELESIVARTEGWIAGLQLAALSLAQRSDRGAFIRAFAGDNRYIMDYLIDEVLSQQEESMRRFLLQTSILEQLSGSLCAAVVGDEEPEASRQRLLQLEAANLFILPLDARREWYRYHPLFRDLLQHELSHVHTAREVASLHQRASEWYEAHNDIAQAVEHALASGDMDHLVSLVRRNAYGVLSHAELLELAARFQQLPESSLQQRPWLAVASAWLEIFAGRLERVEQLLRQTKAALATEVVAGAEADRIAGHMAIIEAYAVGMQGDLEAATRRTAQALHLLPQDDRAARVAAAMLQGSALYWQGKLAAADEAYRMTLVSMEGIHDLQLIVDVLCDVMRLKMTQAKLREAAECGQRALAQARAASATRLPLTGYAHARLAAVYVEWNELVLAERHAREGLELLAAWQQADILVRGYIAGARVLHVCGAPEDAFAVLQEARRVAAILSPWYLARVAAWEAALRLRQGDQNAAWRWAQEAGLSVADPLSFDQTASYLTFARLLLAREETVEALHLLRRLGGLAAEIGASGDLIRVRLLEVGAWRAQGVPERALVCLEEALALAEAEGYVRPFLEEGADLAPLLPQVMARGNVPPAYPRRLLDMLSVVAAPGGESGLVEPLSEREREILTLIAAGCTNREIAQRLVLTLATVKWHNSNIYGKLGVSNRTQAVLQAQERGILPRAD